MVDTTLEDALAVRCRHCRAAPGLPCHDRRLNDVECPRKLGPQPERFTAARDLEVHASDPPPLTADQIRRELAGVRSTVPQELGAKSALPPEKVLMARRIHPPGA